MLAKTLSATPWGVDAIPVEIDVDVYNGLPQTQISGLSEGAVRETRERVRSAIKACAYDLPPRVVVVKLTPEELRKEPNHLDLPIAVAVLASLGQIPQKALEGRMLCGELALDGRVRPVRGGLAVAEQASKLGLRELIVPLDNAAEAAVLGAVTVIGVRSLAEAVEHLLGQAVIPPTPAANSRSAKARAPLAWSEEPDLADVRGQQAAKRALEVATAGGHSLLLVGPPAAGKTMLARRLPGLLPPMTRDEALMVTKVHSMVADQPPAGLLGRRPFRCPHPGVSIVGMAGGGVNPRPGEVSLAHGGVLFLDDLPAYRRDTLESLRQPLAEGLITMVRTRHRMNFPARFQLVAAMDACPCGHLGDPHQRCRCPEPLVRRYLSRINVILESFDLYVELSVPSDRELRSPSGESSADIAKRVHRARKNGAGVRTLTLDSKSEALLATAYDQKRLTAKGLNVAVRVASTIAILDDADKIRAPHMAEGIQYCQRS